MVVAGGDDPAAKKPRATIAAWQAYQVTTLVGFLLALGTAVIAGVAYGYASETRATINACGSQTCAAPNNCTLVACVNSVCMVIGLIPGCCTDSSERTCVSRNAYYNFNEILVNSIVSNNVEDSVDVNGCIFGNAVITCTQGTSDFSSLDITNTLSVDKIAPHTAGGPITFNQTTQFTGTLNVNTIQPFSGNTITITVGTLIVSANAADFSGFIGVNTILPFSGNTLTINGSTMAFIGSLADFFGVIQVNTITTHSGTTLSLSAPVVDVTTQLKTDQIISHTPSGAITFGSPIEFRNMEGGYVMTPLDYYEQFNTTITFAGPFSPNVTALFMFTRFGNVVTATWPQTTGSCTISGKFILSSPGVIPTRFSPNTNLFSLVLVEDSSAVQNVPGIMGFMSNGQVVVDKSPSNTDFSGTNTCGFFAGSFDYTTTN